jgi:hypothetical protein
MNKDRGSQSSNSQDINSMSREDLQNMAQGLPGYRDDMSDSELRQMIVDYRDVDI